MTYYRLRDVAAAVASQDNQFNVCWDNGRGGHHRAALLPTLVPASGCPRLDAVHPDRGRQERYYPRRSGQTGTTTCPPPSWQPGRDSWPPERPYPAPILRGSRRHSCRGASILRERLTAVEHQILLSALGAFRCCCWLHFWPPFFALNRVDKVALVNREGQTFEKGVVVDILQDNLMPDGSRVGEQRVLVRMTTGVRAGPGLETTSASGFLFGAGCTVGMKVVVMQSVAGDSTITSIYSQDREWVIYAFAAAYLLVLCLVGGKQGLKGALGLVFTFFCILFVYLPLVYRGWSPFWVAVLICIVTTLVTILPHRRPLPGKPWWPLAARWRAW